MTTVEFLALHANDWVIGDPSRQFVRYSEELLREYLSQAASTIAEANKEDFAFRKTVTLEPGCVQYLCDNCQEVLEVLSINGDSCEKPTSVSDKSTKLSSMINKYDPGCSDESADEKYEHGGIELLSSSPCAFRTANPVPEGETIEAEILCVEVPSGDDLLNNPGKYDGILNKYNAQIANYALFMVRMGDEESQLSITAANQHFNAYLQLENIRLNREVQAFNQQQASDNN